MPVITLLTDLGTTDSYVGELKGVLASLAASATVVDITHQVAPGDVRAAAYVLGRAWHRFPAGTVHLVIVDPGVGTSRASLALRCSGHYFVAPDNGVLSRVFEHEVGDVIALPTPQHAAPTFHGRDVYAPAVAAIACGQELTALGPAFLGVPKRLAWTKPHYEGKTVVGEVIYVDRFGNLVTSLTPELVPAYATVEVEGIDLGALRQAFGEVPAGGLLAYVGSGGTVEVAVRDGSAARRLGLGVGERVRVRLG